MIARPSLLLLLAGLLGCGTTGAGPADTLPDAASDDGATSGSDSAPPTDAGGDTVVAADATPEGEGGAPADADVGTDGDVLAGPAFDPGFAPCGQATLDDTALRDACSATMGGTPNAPPSTPLQCAALTGSVDVAVGCKELACSGYQCIQVEFWVRVTARSRGTWTFDPSGEIHWPSDAPIPILAGCWSQTQTPGGFENENDPGGICGGGWQGARSFVTNADATMARMVYVPGGTYTASGQPIAGTIWFPFEQLAPPPSTSGQVAFALAVPFRATIP